MKKFFFLVLLPLLCSLVVNASDWSKFGIKGECIKASSQFETLNFDNNGNLTGFILVITGSRIESTGAIQTVKNGFTGKCKIYENNTTETGSYQITIGPNGITKLSVKYDDGSTLTSTYSYNSNGLLVKRIDDAMWWEEDSYSLETDAAARERKAQAVIDAAYKAAARKPLDIAGNARRLEAAERKAAAILAGTDVKVKTKKTKKTAKETVVFDSYKSDEFNNWTYRQFKDDDGNHNENREIKYTDDFLCRIQWEKLKQSGNLKAIEMFAMNNRTTEKYKKIASEFWNSNILPKIARQDNNNPDSLCYAAFSPVANKETSDKALNMARRDIYDNQVMQERDFNKVKAISTLKVRDQEIFDLDYKNRIDERAEQLRNDSISFLLKQSENALSSGQLSLASQEAKKLLVIDELNYQAKEIASKADFMMIENKEKAGSVTDIDYINFCDYHKDSPRAKTVADKYAQYAINKKSQYKKDGNYDSYPSYLNGVLAKDLPMSQNARADLSKNSEKSRIELASGRPIGFGVGFAFAGSTGNDFRFEIGPMLRLGRLSSPINAQVSLAYGYSSGNSNGEKGPNLTSSRFLIPVMLRWNFVRKLKEMDKLDEYIMTCYLAAGAQLSIPLGGKLNYSSEQDDYVKLEKDFLSKTYISPKIAIGVHGLKYFELELFGIYHTNSLYNKDNLFSIGADELLGQKLFDKNTKKPQIQIGGAFRIVF